MSKKGVAEALGVTSATIHRYETGATKPSDEVVAELSLKLEIPKEFFFGRDIDPPRQENVSFRGLASKTQKVMLAAQASGAMAYIFDDWISDRYDRITPDLPPEIKETVSPSTAASIVREHWRLGDKPIDNMVHLLEAKGIRVFSLAQNTKEVDAFSVWRDDVPYVFLNRFKSPERSRFDAAHELGHLIMHKHGGAAAIHKNSPVEAEANSFAGAFLMPEADVRAVVTSTVFSLDQVKMFKKRWRVSAAALVYRLNELGMISSARSNSFYVEMSRRGWLKNEPDSCTREQSYAWQQIIDDLRSQGITKNHIVTKTGVPMKEIEALLFGLANMFSIDGEGVSTPRNSNHLRLIS